MEWQTDKCQIEDDVLLLLKDENEKNLMLNYGRYTDAMLGYEVGKDGLKPIAWMETPKQDDEWIFCSEQLPTPKEQEEWNIGMPEYIMCSESGFIMLGWYGKGGWYSLIDQDDKTDGDFYLELTNLKQFRESVLNKTYTIGNKLFYTNPRDIETVVEMYTPVKWMQSPDMAVSFLAT